MSKTTKNQQQKSVSEAQTARIPLRNASEHPRLNLDDFLLFKTTGLPQEEIDQYLDYCRKIFPCRDTKLGTIFSEDIDVQRALEVLHRYNYNVPEAKFHLTFPVLSKYCQLKNIPIESTLDYQSMIDDFARQKSVQFSSKEKSYFDELVAVIEQRKAPILFKDIEELVQEGVKKRYACPESLRHELSKCEALSNEIAYVLRESRVHGKLEALLRKSERQAILPKNMDELVQAKAVFEEMIGRVAGFMASRERDIKAMQKIVSDLRMHNINCAAEPALQPFWSFAAETQAVLEKVQILSRPYRSKEAGQKFNLQDVFDIMKYFHQHSIRNDKKVDDLLYNVYRHEIQKENCLMFLEDERELNTQPFATFVDDLRKCALDYEAEIALTELKVQSVEIFNFLSKNVRNDRFIDECLKKVEQFEKLNSPFKRAEVAEMRAVLSILKELDVKAEEIEKGATTIHEFLFGGDSLVETGPIVALFERLRARGGGFAETALVKKIMRFVNEFELKTGDPALLAGTDLRHLIRSAGDLLASGLKNARFAETLRERIVNALEIEYFVVRLLEKFTNERVGFGFEEFASSVRAQVLGIQSFDRSVEMAREMIEHLLNPELRQKFEFYAAKREEINGLLNANASQALDEPRLAELERAIRETFKDKELLNKLKVVAETKKKKDVLQVLEARMGADYLAHQDLEREMLRLSDRAEESQQFFAAHQGRLFEVYRRALGYEEEVFREDLDELFGLLNKQLSCRDDFSDELFSTIKKLKDIVTKNSLECQEIMKDDEKNEGRFVLKVFFLILIFHKVRCLGVRPDFCNNIQHFVDKYLEIERFLDPRHKKTLREIRYNTLKYAELKLYSPSVRALKEVVELATAFKDAVEMVETKFNGDSVTSNLVLGSLGKAVRLADYEVEIVQNSITLGRRKFAPLDNKDFQNFLNSTGKRIKKFKAVADNGNAEELELSDPASLRVKRVVPVVYHDSEEFCMCREAFEIKSMMQYNVCAEWFHQECIKMPHYLMEKNKDDFCFGCDYLAGRPNEKVLEFQKRKAKLPVFRELLRCYYLLKEFVLDEEIDFIGFVIGKLNKLVAEIEKTELLVNEGVCELALKSIHTCALLYLYVPVKLPDIEAKIFSLNLAAKAFLNK